MVPSFYSFAGSGTSYSQPIHARISRSTACPSPNIIIASKYMENDAGHKLLIEDLKRILALAESFEFHDFRNVKFPAPKMELCNQIDRIKINVMQGAYDN